MGVDMTSSSRAGARGRPRRSCRPCGASRGCPTCRSTPWEEGAVAGVQPHRFAAVDGDRHRSGNQLDELMGLEQPARRTRGALPDPGRGASGTVRPQLQAGLSASARRSPRRRGRPSPRGRYVLPRQPGAGSRGLSCCGPFRKPGGIRQGDGIRGKSALAVLVEAVEGQIRDVENISAAMEHEVGGCRDARAPHHPVAACTRHNAALDRSVSREPGTDDGQVVGVQLMVAALLADPDRRRDGQHRRQSIPHPAVVLPVERAGLAWLLGAGCSSPTAARPPRAASRCRG